jgi:predicted PurR-regulated permease PerM
VVILLIGIGVLILAVYIVAVVQDTREQTRFISAQLAHLIRQFTHEGRQPEETVLEKLNEMKESLDEVKESMDNMAADLSDHFTEKGTRVGPYEIISAIGAGGMGEVYRARDTTVPPLVVVCRG